MTLNPLAHISLFGTIILPLLAHFGWAKPVPVDFSVLTSRQIFKVAAAGPVANILVAVILTIAFHLFRLRASRSWAILYYWLYCSILSWLCLILFRYHHWTAPEWFMPSSL